MGGTFITGDSTSSSSRAIVKNVKIIVKDPIKDFVTTLILRLRKVPHLRVAIEMAENK